MIHTSFFFLFKRRLGKNQRDDDNCNFETSVRTSIDSLRSHNIELARTIAKTEQEVDEMYLGYLDRLVEEASRTSKCTISSVLMVRYLKRIADHATYICGSVIYLATGEKITLR